MITIYNRFTGVVLLTADAADLQSANLRGANLQSANLRDADLQRADLQRADLQRADLRGADLRGADLRGANLRDADLQRADLQRADLQGTELPAGVPQIPAIDAAILATVSGARAPGKLDMVDWHTCATTHCRAGWAIHLAGDAGQKLEDRFGSSAAGALIYAASGSYPVPNFVASNEEALADMRRRDAALRGKR